MTTGRDVFERAMRLLGYTGGNGQLDGPLYTELFKRGLPLVNQIYSDLWFLEQEGAFHELCGLQQPIKLSLRCVHDVMPYGVAMLLAQTESDGDDQALFASLYNQKRSSLQQLTRRRDVLPRGGGCV